MRQFASTLNEKLTKGNHVGMVGAAGIEPATLGLEILGSDVTLRVINGLSWCPMLESDAMLRHSTAFGHQFGH